MDYKIVYLNAITVMSHITQKLHSGILLYCQAKAISQTQSNFSNHSINEARKSDDTNFFLTKFYLIYQITQYLHQLTISACFPPST